MKLRKLKVLLPGGASKAAFTVLALGGTTAAVVFGTQAAWTDQTTNTGNSVTAGSLNMTNDKDAASIISATDVAPGGTGSNTVVITNAGTLPMSVNLTQDTISNTFTANMLKLKVHDDTRNWCYWPATGAGACATWGDWNGSATMTNLAIANTAGGAMWPASQAHTFTVTYELDATSPSVDSGKTGSFRLVWDGSS